MLLLLQPFLHVQQLMVFAPAPVFPTQLHADPVPPPAVLALDLAPPRAQAHLAQVVLSHQVEPCRWRQFPELPALAECVQLSSACPHLAAPPLFLCLMTCVQSIHCFWVGPFSRAASQDGLQSFLALSLPAALDVQKAVVAGLACRLPAGIRSLLPVRALPGRLIVAWCQTGHAQLETLH